MTYSISGMLQRIKIWALVEICIPSLLSKFLSCICFLSNFSLFFFLLFCGFICHFSIWIWWLSGSAIPPVGFVRRLEVMLIKTVSDGKWFIERNWNWLFICGFKSVTNSISSMLQRIKVWTTIWIFVPFLLCKILCLIILNLFLSCFISFLFCFFFNHLFIFTLWKNIRMKVWKASCSCAPPVSFVWWCEIMLVKSIGDGKWFIEWLWNWLFVGGFKGVGNSVSGVL